MTGWEFNMTDKKFPLDSKFPQPDRVFLLCGRSMAGIKKDLDRLWPGVEVVILAKKGDPLAPEGALTSTDPLSGWGRDALIANGGNTSMAARALLACSSQVAVLDLQPDGLEVIQCPSRIPDGEGSGHVDWEAREWNLANAAYFREWEAAVYSR